MFKRREQLNNINAITICEIGVIIVGFCDKLLVFKLCFSILMLGKNQIINKNNTTFLIIIAYK